MMTRREGRRRFFGREEGRKWIRYIESDARRRIGRTMKEDSPSYGKCTYSLSLSLVNVLELRGETDEVKRETDGLPT